MSEKSISFKKLFLYALIVSVGISAFLGIIAILSGDFGELQVKVLLTSVTISAASLAGLCCGATYEAGRVRHFAAAGMLLVAVAAVMILVGMWSEVSWEDHWKMTVTVSVFAVGFAHLCLLQLARLSKGYRWSLPTAYVLVFGLCGTISLLLWSESSNDELFRFMGVNAILVGAISLLIPILHRLSRGEISLEGSDVEATLADIDYEIAGLKHRIQELESMKLRLLSSI